MRIDVAVKEKLGISRQKAQMLIEEGSVKLNGSVVFKSAVDVSQEDVIEVCRSDVLKYVGRGALKLEKALKFFNIDVRGLVCLDIGASTGGFTDCLLQSGAKTVYALDVGKLQLDEKLKNDCRVISMENTDIREANLPQVDFICMDVSFISVTKVIYKVNEFLKSDGDAVVLIKPQFEAGRKNLDKHGVVKDKSVHRRVLTEIIDFANNIGFNAVGLTYSPIRGGDGNTEYLLYLTKNLDKTACIDIESTIKEAFAGLNR